MPGHQSDIRTTIKTNTKFHFGYQPSFEITQLFCQWQVTNKENVTHHKNTLNTVQSFKPFKIHNHCFQCIALLRHNIHKQCAFLGSGWVRLMIVYFPSCLTSRVSLLQIQNRCLNNRALVSFFVQPKWRKYQGPIVTSYVVTQLALVYTAACRRKQAVC